MIYTFVWSISVWVRYVQKNKKKVSTIDANALGPCDTGLSVDIVNLCQIMSSYYL